MPAGPSAPPRLTTTALSLVCIALVSACGSSSSGTPSSVTGSMGTSSPGASIPATTAPSVVAAAHLPTSCSQIASLVGAYMGGVATTHPLGPTPSGVSCEFLNPSATSVIIVNIGGGATPAAFATTRAIAGSGGRTVTSVGGLGASAFSISKGGVPAGFEVLTPQGDVFAVTARLSFAQDEAMIEQLMAQY